MKKLLIAGGAITGAAFLARRAGRAAGGVDFERLALILHQGERPGRLTGAISSA